MHPALSTTQLVRKEIPSLHQYAARPRKEHMLDILQDIGSWALLSFSSFLFYQGSIVATFFPGITAAVQLFLLTKTSKENQQPLQLLDNIDCIIRPATLIHYLASFFFIAAFSTGSIFISAICTTTFLALGSFSYCLANYVLGQHQESR